MAPTRECDCGMGIETVKHLVLSCSRHHQLRQTIWKGDGPTDLREELDNKQKAIKIAVFLLRSGTLGQQGRANKSAEEILRHWK